MFSKAETLPKLKYTVKKKKMYSRNLVIIYSCSAVQSYVLIAWMHREISYC